MPRTSQIPQCEGRNADRLLFNALAPSKARVVYTISVKDGKYIMDAGSIHGVTQEAWFSLHSSRDSSPNDTPLATMVATTVNVFSSELTLSDTSLRLPSLSRHRWARRRLFVCTYRRQKTCDR